MNTNLVENIKLAGVVGAGGAGFPTHIKLSAKARVLLVNAAECEPLIRVDQQLLMSNTEEFLHGLAIASDLVGAERVIIALKKKHTEVIATLTTGIADKPHIELALLGDYYPAGDEQIMVYDILDKVIPRGGIPLAQDTIVSNVETLINVARAEKKKPVTTTFVTVTGDVPAPATFELPVGMSYREALSLAGATETAGKRAIDGGPMMGKLIDSLDEPITKTTKALILLGEDQRVIVEKRLTDGQILKQSRTACLQCQKCTDLCPRDLLGHDVKPHVIMRIANYGISDFEGMKRAFGCSECGACALYSCPSDLSPRRIFMLIKKQLSDAGVKPDENAAPPSASEMFAYRKIPVKRLVARLGLTAFDKAAPLSAVDYQPKRVEIALKQHLGVPATATVTAGDVVKRGALIGHIEDTKLGASVHASIDGTVVAVRDTAVVIERN